MKYLFCDLDNTLYFNINNSYKIKDEDIVNIKNNTENIKIVITTGRHKDAANKVSQILGTALDSISLNGLNVTTKAKDYYLGSISSEKYREICNDLNKKFVDLNYGSITFDGVYLTNDTTKEPYNRFINHQKAGIIKYVSSVNGIHYIKDNNIKELTKILIYVGDYKGDKNKILEYLKEKYPLYDFIFSSEIFIEGLCKNVNKASGIEQYLKLNGIDFNNCYCIGDSDNDIEMFELLGKHSFCIESGSVNAKKKAGTIVKSVSEALEFINND